MPFDRRLLLTTSLSFLSGFTLGSLNAGHMASLRFRAENARLLCGGPPLGERLGGAGGSTR